MIDPHAANAPIRRSVARLPPTNPPRANTKEKMTARFVKMARQYSMNALASLLELLRIFFIVILGAIVRLYSPPQLKWREVGVRSV